MKKYEYPKNIINYLTTYGCNHPCQEIKDLINKELRKDQIDAFDIIINNFIYPRYRKIINLRFKENRSYNEISEILNISKANINNIICKTINIFTYTKSVDLILNGVNEEYKKKTSLYTLNLSSPIIKKLIQSGITSVEVLVEYIKDNGGISLINLPKFGKISSESVINELINKNYLINAEE